MKNVWEKFAVFHKLYNDHKQTEPRGATKW